MGPDPFVTSPFKGPTLEGDTYDYHVIITDHPYMQEIGLSAFTTGELASWIFKKDKKDDFSNLKIFGFEIEEADSGKLPEYAEKILGLKGLVGDSFTFSAWRFDANNFEPYKNTLQSSSNWKYEQGKEKYTFQDLNFAEFLNKKTKIPDFSAPVTNIQLEYQNNIDDKVSNAIEMNNFVRYLRMSLPKSEWTKTQKARSEFILDIKSSFNKYIEWSGVVPFTLNLGVPTTLDGQETDKCIKEEVVKFKLFLFDESLTKNNSRRVTLNELVLVRPQVDAFGRVGTKSNGEISALSTQPNPKQNKAGSLNIKWNEFEGKWESGTEQVIGMMVTPLKAAVFPSLDEWMNQPILDLITSLTIPVGSAMPLVMPNGNPFQIAPEYNSREGCRDKEDNNKFMVRVYNRLPVEFNSGDIVILNKIDGVWQPSIFEKTSDVDNIAVGIDGKWDFVYLMTNADYFFCTKDKSIVDNKNFEEGIRTLYYWNDLKNRPQNTGSINYAEVDNGYFQVTSWDFMGPNIGGLRSSKNALACTHWNFNPLSDGFASEYEEDPYYWSNKSLPFFGCVFPDGYDTGDKFGLYKGTHPHLKPSNWQESADELYYFMKPIDEEINLFENKNANTAGGNAGGMFIKADDSTLIHLPADIALNSSPEGENGSTLKPILPFRYLAWYSAEESEMKNVPNQIDSLFFNYDENKQKSFRLAVWMTSGNKAENAYGGSAFDFKPISPGYISFRPLRAECYANFEFKEWNGNSQTPKSQKYWTFGPGSEPSVGTKDRGEFGARNWINVDDEESPISLVALTRNSKNQIDGKNELIDSTWGLRYNIDIQADNPRFPPVGARFSKPNWSREWMHGRGPNLEENRPAGAVGIIAAQCTVAATTSVNIECESLIGMQSWFIGGQDPDQDWSASWGGYGGTNYNNFQTTELHVRMFHAWPRDLTIYDPRFFSVFHFNPGVGIADHDGKRARIYDWYNDGEKQTGEPPDNATFSYPTGWYKVEKSQSIVDARVPTLIGVDNYGLSTTAEHGQKVNKFTLRNKDDSNLNLTRRGKLLPYTCDILTVSVGNAAGTSLTSYPAYTSDEKISPANIDIVILCPGSGYSTNDRFTTFGGAGEGILLKPTIGNGASFDGINFTNGIIGFEIISSGYNFNGQDFLDIPQISGNKRFSGKIIDDSGAEVPLTIRIVPTLETAAKTNGKKLNAGFARGIVSELRVNDKKPEELYNNQPLRESFQSQARTASPVWPPVGSKNTELLISSFNTDTTFGLKDKYDLFFFFHNDVSHTFSYGDDNILPEPISHEQHITINIVPN